MEVGLTGRLDYSIKKDFLTIVDWNDYSVDRTGRFKESIGQYRPIKDKNQWQSFNASNEKKHRKSQQW